MVEDRPMSVADRATPMRCEDIRDVLFEYMTRELGPARSGLVREHLRRCPGCQQAVAEIQGTLDLLRAAPPRDDEVPSVLTPERRKRIAWSVMHPLLDAIYRYHVIVSFIVAIVVVLAVLFVLGRLPPWQLDTTAGTEVIIGQGPAPQEE